MVHLINGKNANEIWAKCVDLIHSSGKQSTNTNELLHALIHLEDPRQKWVAVRKPAMSIGFALAELIWIISGKDDRATIDCWNPSYAGFAADKDSDVYHGAYGYRLRNNFAFDQLKSAYNTLRSNPNSRQVVLLYWDPNKDIPHDNGTPRSKDIPCNVCSLIKVRDGKLEWTQIMRSNDVFRGLPYNLIQFTSLQEVLAGWLNLEVGSYTHFSDSLHLYDNDSDIGIDEFEYTSNTDSLSIPFADFECVLQNICERMRLLMKPELTEAELEFASILNSQYNAYNNIMLMIGLYIASKRGYTNVIESLEAKCDNLLYLRIWHKYLEKKTSKS